jgi:hypothetical protein
MRTQLRLNSVVRHGVGSGPESGAIDLIYAFLLTEFEQDIYKYISINQIGNDLKEFVMKEAGDKIYVNICYPVYEDFETKNLDEKNHLRLDVIHTALLRVANQYGKLEIKKLEQIKEKVINNNFSFDFVCKIYRYKKSKNLLAKIIVHPEMDRFDYYCLIEENDKVKCKVKIYSGLTDLYYYRDLFSDVKWKSQDEIIITGKAKQVEISVLINECTAAFKNLTQYEKAPYFEMMRGDIPKSEREIAHLNWLHSLPPAHAALLRESHN